MLNEAYARTFIGGQIEILWHWEYFGFSLLILGYKQTFTVKKFHDIELISGKFIIYVGHSYVNGNAPWSYNGKSLFVDLPLDKLGKTHICQVPDNN